LNRKLLKYIPDRGDFVWISLSPTSEHEQAGRRPALVVSPKSYNSNTGLCVICPATRQAKGYAFEVAIDRGDGNAGEPCTLTFSLQCKSSVSQFFESRYVLGRESIGEPYF
jgi:mRNA-degrading endonuclease toxin of MazEF toxin-antitoxin module